MDFSAEFRKLEEHFNSSISNFNIRLQRAIDTSGTTPSFKHLQDDFSAFKNDITSALDDIGKIFVNFDCRIDTLENESRKNCILIHGVGEKETEDPVSLLENVIATMGLEADIPTDVCLDDIHRLGKPLNMETTRPRPLLVTFTKFKYKNTIWSAKKKLKGSGIVITEFLTKRRQKLYADARTALGSKNVWTHNGEIHVVVGKRRSKICSSLQIQELKSTDVHEAEAAPSQRLPSQSARPHTRSRNVSK